jgi:hypothetical protein
MNVADAIRTIAKPADEVYSVVGVVIAVNADARTCDVRPSNGMADIFDVRIQAAPMGDEGLSYTPKVGSVVIVTFLNRHTGYVSAASELKNWHLICNDVRLGDDIAEKAVKGDTLNARLSDMIAQQRSALQALLQYCTAQAAVTASGPLAPLAPGYASLAAAITPIVAQLAVIENLLGNHLSEKVRIG